MDAYLTAAYARERVSDLAARAEQARQAKLAKGERARRFRVGLRRNRAADGAHVVLRPAFTG
jgi:hypothetical protein